MRKVSLILALAAVFVLSLLAGITEPVQVEGGLVSGTPGWGWGVREFRGIPFAAPPLGELRWQPPQPVVPWEGVLAADHFAAACTQEPTPTSSYNWHRGFVNFSEDCLYLNVWTPASTPDERLPVMIWYHGGGGRMNTASKPEFDGNSLAKKGVVVVTTNYRLDVFGWLAHPELSKESEHGISGNYGALDQLAAIRWVKNNIANFGGDPEKITIFGQSAGSRSVNWLAASPLTKGLIQGVIAESHVVFNRMETLEEAEATGLEFLKASGKRSIAELRAMSDEDLLAASLESSMRFGGAIVDGWFLPNDIYTIYSRGEQNDIPLITGATNDEGMALRRGRFPGAAGEQRSGSPETLADYRAWVKFNFGDRADELLKHYPATNDAEAQRVYHDVYRDINFEGHRTYAKLQATTGKAPVYLYMFSHVPPHPETNGNNPPTPVGAVHSSEYIYVFDNLRMKDYQWTSADRRMAQIMSTYWSNFAKTGNPSGEGAPNWPVYNPNDEYWLNIGDTIRPERFNSAGVDVISDVQEEMRRAR